MLRKKLVVFTGAGISAESGLRTFRDQDGLWENRRVEDVATPEAWRRDPGLVLHFYNERRRDVLHARPNKAHLGVALLEKYFDVIVVTQNIDDLHERAGSSEIIHLHGEILKMRSEQEPGKLFSVTTDMLPEQRAPGGSRLRPHVVWFGEAVPHLEMAAAMVAAADIFVLIGSSLQVYPAAGLLQYVGRDTPVFVLDKKIPHIPFRNIRGIEKPATAGIDDLIALLLQLY